MPPNITSVSRNQRSVMMGAIIILSLEFIMSIVVIRMMIGDDLTLFINCGSNLIRGPNWT